MGVFERTWEDSLANALQRRRGLTNPLYVDPIPAPADITAPMTRGGATVPEPQAVSAGSHGMFADCAQLLGDIKGHIDAITPMLDDLAACSIPPGCSMEYISNILRQLEPEMAALNDAVREFNSGRCTWGGITPSGWDVPGVPGV